MLELNIKTRTKTTGKAAAQSRIVCGACGHVRKDTDTNPAWQCPNCKSAYNKVSVAKKEYTKAELKELNKQRWLRTKIKHTTNRFNASLVGIYVGAITYLSSLGSACRGIAANPAGKFIGAAVVIASIAYVIYKVVNK